MDLESVGEPLQEDSPMNISSDQKDDPFYFVSSSHDSDDSESPSFAQSREKRGRPGHAAAESNSTVEKLNVTQIRWFYKEENEKKWSPLIGYDSCQLEWKYQKLVVLGDVTDDDELLVLVRGGLYEVDLFNKRCSPVYWQDEACAVMRGTWYYQSNRQPLDVELAQRLEEEHMEKFRGEKAETVGSVNAKTPTVHHLNFGNHHIDWYSPSDIYLYWNTTGHRIARSIGQSIGLSKASTSGYRLIRGYPVMATLEDKPAPVSHLVFVVHGVGQIMDKKSNIKTCASLSKGKQKVVRKHFPDLLSMGCVKRAEFLPVEWRSPLNLDRGIVASITPERLKGLRNALNSSVMDILYYTSPLYRSEIIKCLLGELNRLYALFCERNEGFEPNGGKVSIFGHSLGCVITYDILTGWNPIHLYDQYLSHERGAHPDLVTVSDEQQGLAEELQGARRKVAALEDQLLATNQVAVAISTSSLKFKVENLFCIGSPLGVFLALRGVRPSGKGAMDHLLPKRACRRLFNIYFPSDPVAYRIEPLIVRHYCTIEPVQMHCFESKSQPLYHTMKPIPYSAATKTGEEMKGSECSLTSPDGQDEDAIAESSANTEKRRKSSGGLWNMLSWSGAKDSKPSEVKNTSRFSFSSRWYSEETVKTKPDDLEELQNALSADVSVPSWSTMDFSNDEKVDLEERIDFELKESSYGSLYYAALTSHTSYWSSLDTVLFVMTQLFPDYLESRGQ